MKCGIFHGRNRNLILKFDGITNDDKQKWELQRELLWKWEEMGRRPVSQTSDHLRDPLPVVSVSDLPLDIS